MCQFLHTTIVAATSLGTSYAYTKANVVNNYSVKFAEWRIRTAVLCHRKQPLSQLWHNHSPIKVVTYRTSSPIRTPIRSLSWCCNHLMSFVIFSFLYHRICKCYYAKPFYQKVPAKNWIVIPRGSTFPITTLLSIVVLYVVLSVSTIYVDWNIKLLSRNKVFALTKLHKVLLQHFKSSFWRPSSQ